MVKYTIVVDYGKPYDIKVNTDMDLKKELKKLKSMYESNADDYHFFDTFVYDKNDKDITNKVFKKLRI